MDLDTQENMMAHTLRPVLRTQRQASFCKFQANMVFDLHSNFQGSQGYILRPCFKKTKTTSSKDISIEVPVAGNCVTTGVPNKSLGWQGK